MNTITQLTGEQLSGTITGTEEILTNVVDTTHTLASTLPDYLSQGVVGMFTTFNIPFYLIVFFWILTIIWVIKDSNYRSHSIGFVLFSLLLVTLGTPLIGLPIYLAIRPLGYKYERAYWKAIMTEGGEDDEYEEYAQEYVVNNLQKEELSDPDEDHLEQLKKQATVSKRRITTRKTTSTSKTPVKTTAAKKTTIRTTQSNRPVAKKPTSRSAR